MAGAKIMSLSFLLTRVLQKGNKRKQWEEGCRLSALWDFSFLFLPDRETDQTERTSRCVTHLSWQGSLNALCKQRSIWKSASFCHLHRLLDKKLKAFSPSILHLGEGQEILSTTAQQDSGLFAATKQEGTYFHSHNHSTNNWLPLWGSVACCEQISEAVRECPCSTCDAGE